MKQILVIIAIVFLGCSSNNLEPLSLNNLLICDPYFAEQKNQSRYIKINGIKGNKIESKYLTTEQRHIFNSNDLVLELNFYHRLIEDQISNEPKVEYEIKKLKQVKFGVLEILLKPKESKTIIDKSTLDNLVNSISIEEFENSEVVLSSREPITNIPQNLIKIGASKFEKSKHRKVLTINIKDESEEAIIRQLYLNSELLYKHLDDSDLIEFKRLDSKRDIIRTFILVNSFGKDIDSSDWCGMGPKIKRFECIYVNNHDL